MQDISAMRRKDNKMDNEKKMPLNDLIRSTMDKVHEMADTNTIVGQPISTADNLKALIYFTDGDGIYPEKTPDYETAFVFVKKSEKMDRVPGWAKKLLVTEK